MTIDSLIMEEMMTMVAALGIGGMKGEMDEKSHSRKMVIRDTAVAADLGAAAVAMIVGVGAEAPSTGVGVEVEAALIHAIDTIPLVAITDLPAINVLPPIAIRICP